MNVSLDENVLKRFHISQKSTSMTVCLSDRPRFSQMKQKLKQILYAQNVIHFFVEEKVVERFLQLWMVPFLMMDFTIQNMRPQ